MTPRRPKYEIRNTRPEDFPGIIDMTTLVYIDSPPWTMAQLGSHLDLFPEGQFVAVESASQRVVGMAASLIVQWEDYDMHHTWREVTAKGTFRTHDPSNGRTLYGAEVMVHPELQKGGIGKRLYKARRDLTRRLGLRRIRAGARLHNYHRFAERMSAEEYVIRVVNGRLGDPTLSFQLKQGFNVLAVVKGYIRHDPQSLGYAAVIEWLNPEVATPGNSKGRDPRFIPKP